MTGELPGEDLIRKGFTDLAAGILSDEALLIAIAKPRLERLGIVVDLSKTPPLSDWPETLLYRSLARQDPDSAHSRYNALIRRLISYEHALELQEWIRSRKDPF